MLMTLLIFLVLLAFIFLGFPIFMALLIIMTGSGQERPLASSIFMMVILL